MTINDIVRGLKFRACRTHVPKDRIGKADIGILKVAFMVAALDGEVTDAEYKAFDALTKKCRGYTPEGAAEALDAAMHSAGYLMLLSKRVKTADLVKAFVAEARAALPEGFAYCSIEDVRRAIATWIVVGMSDGDYSVRERTCIEALRREFAELVIKRADEETERWSAFAPNFSMAYGKRIKLIEKDFVTRVEELAAQYGNTAAAVKDLQKLIVG